MPIFSNIPRKSPLAFKQESSCVVGDDDDDDYNDDDDDNNESNESDGRMTACDGEATTNQRTAG